jgi:hypothetical protein
MRIVPDANKDAGERALLTDKANRRVLQLSWAASNAPTTFRVGDYGKGARKVIRRNSKFPVLADLTVSPNDNYVYLSCRTAENGSTGIVWFCDKNDKTTLLDTMGPTCSIEVDYTSKYLYVFKLVKTSASTYNKIWRYNLNSSTGKASGKALFYQFGSSTSSDASEIMSIRADKIGALLILRNEHSEITKLRRNGKVLAIVHTTYGTSP